MNILVELLDIILKIVFYFSVNSIWTKFYPKKDNKFNKMKNK